MDELNMWGIEHQNGEVTWVDSRLGLAADKLQGVLATAKRKEEHFFCRCSAQLLRLFPVKTASGRGWTLRCAAHENTHHARTCPARVDELDAMPPPTLPVVYPASILLAPGEAAPNDGETVKPKVGLRESASGPQRGTLTHLTHQLLMTSTLTALRAANPPPVSYSDSLIYQPNREEILEEMLERMTEPLMEDSQSPVEAAAKAKLRIYWGVTPLPIVSEMARLETEDGVVEFVARGHWSTDGIVVGPQEFRIGRTSAMAVGGNVAAHDRIIAPPYFYLLTANQDNEIARMVVVPIASNPRTLCGINSEPERTLADALTSYGLGFVTGIAKGDFAHLGPRLWPCPTTEGRGWLPRRPDFLVFSFGLTVVQLLGSKDPEYLDDVGRAHVELTAHLQHPAVNFKNATLADLAPPALLQWLEALRSEAKAALSLSTSSGNF